MRYRLLLLLLLASLLGLPVLAHRATVARRCALISDPTVCSAIAPDPAWVVPAGLLSAVSLGYAAVLFMRASAARRREKVMLDAVGVHVREQDLPLEE